MFTTEQVVRLTGAPRRRLDQLVAQSVVHGSVDRPAGTRHVRLFSFDELVAVRVAHWLRVVQRADGAWEDWSNGQLVLDQTVPLEAVVHDLRSRVEADHQARRARRPGAVERRRGVLGGAAVVAGTRVPVYTLRSLHRAGWTASRIVESYPAITVADVEAAVNGSAA